MSLPSPITYGNVRQTVGARPVSDFHIDLALGNISNCFYVNKFGRNPSVGSTQEDIWASGGVYSWPTAAEPIRVRAGGNANDTAAGTGARKLVAEGLDDSLNLVSAEIIPAGVSASASTSVSFFRVFRVYVSETGSYTGVNTGAITIENETTNDILAYIEAGVSQTQLSMYTIPNGYKGLLHRIALHVDDSKAVDFKMWHRQNADTVSAPFTAKRIFANRDQVNGEVTINFITPLMFPGKTDLRATGETQSGTSALSVFYDLTLVKEAAWTRNVGNKFLLLLDSMRSAPSARFEMQKGSNS